MKRGLNELYNKVLEYYESGLRQDIGICINLEYMHEAKIITRKEWVLLKDHLNKNKPEGAQENNYWFKTIYERVIFLNQMIILTCEHKHINREDGLDECLDCGIKNY